MFEELPRRKTPSGRGQAVLYLDFDGVLMHENVLWHPRRGAFLHAPAGYRLFQHAPLLEEMLQPYPGIQVVLTTSWVRQYGCAGAAKRLPPGLRRRVIGATYHSRMPAREFAELPRGIQVTQDVLRRRPGSWLALDDNPEGWPDWSAPHFLQTDPVEGISPPQFRDELRQRLALLADLQPPSRFPVLPNVQENTMSVWTIVPVELRPDVTLESWAVFEVPLNGLDHPWTRHFAGYSLEDGQGQVCSPVEFFDPVNGQCVTRSGRVYRLRGRPGLNPDAEYVWRRWKRIAGVTEERDVTQEVFAELQAAKAGGCFGLAD